MKKLNTPKKILAFLLKWTFLIFMLLFTIYPVTYAFLGSFKTNMEVVRGTSFLPESWQLDNYITAFTRGNFDRYTFNSVAISVMVTIFALIMASMAGYVFARMDFYGKKLLHRLYMSFMFISLGSVTLYPIYALFTTVGLAKTLLGMALVITGAQVSNIFLVQGFIRSVPRELDEAAYIDGCNPFQVYAIMILPVIRPVLAVVGLFSFRGAWNNYITPQVMSIGATHLRTLTVAVVSLRDAANAATEWHIMLAGASIALLPMLLVYAATNRQFISGLTAGAVKG